MATKSISHEIAKVLLTTHLDKKMRLYVAASMPGFDLSTLTPRIVEINKQMTGAFLTSELPIEAYAVAYDAMLREALGEAYSRQELDIFLSTRNRLISDYVGMSYFASDVELKILDIVYKFYVAQ